MQNSRHHSEVISYSDSALHIRQYDGRLLMPNLMDKIRLLIMSLAPVEALTMADMRNLLDLPNELLAIIFRFHFEQVKVGIVYLREGQRRNTTKTKFFLSAMLSCKPLGQIAQREFLRHVELVVNEFDWCSEYLDKPHWRNAKKTIMPALVPAPFEFIRNVMSSIEAFLPLLEAGDSRESGLNDFTNLESLVIVDTLKYRSGNFGKLL